MRPASDLWLAQRGVTLIEMIVAIVVTGILVVIVSMFVRNQVQSYSDVAVRTELADAADSAVRRIARDLQSALPNSVRTSGNFLEYVPIKDAGRYRAQKGVATDDELNLGGSAVTESFEVFGPPVRVEANDQLVLYNLGIQAVPVATGSDVYDGSSRRALASGAGNNWSSLSYTVGAGHFPLASLQNRFQIVGGPVTLECAPNSVTPESGQIVRRWCYGYTAGQPTAFGASAAYPGCANVQSAVVVSGVSACSLNYTAAALQRNGIASIRIALSRNGETVTLFHQVAIMNSP
jgi:MSHA biogenesis protein MshO